MHGWHPASRLGQHDTSNRWPLTTVLKGRWRGTRYWAAHCTAKVKTYWRLLVTATSVVVPRASATSVKARLRSWRVEQPSRLEAWRTFRTVGSVLDKITPPSPKSIQPWTSSLRLYPPEYESPAWSTHCPPWGPRPRVPTEIAIVSAVSFATANCGVRSTGPPALLMTIDATPDPSAVAT